MPDLEAPLTSSHSLELWAGPECTCNRVGDRFSDQLERIGHGGRIEDLALIAGLGAKAIRYPVLWEKAIPLPDAEPAWAWSDERLTRIRALGMGAIVGLLHHGSGPIYTSIIDPKFPQ
jgi:dTDP-4-dehydrorhamnose reductase